MNVIQKSRMANLINYLRSMDKSQFDYRYWTRPNHPCGTICCAAGCLPKIDPNNWFWDKRDGNYIPILESSNTEEVFTNLGKYFGLTINECVSLFYWGSISSNGIELTAKGLPTPSPKAIARLLEVYCFGCI